MPIVYIETGFPFLDDAWEQISQQINNFIVFQYSGNQAWLSMQITASVLEAGVWDLISVPYIQAFARTVHAILIELISLFAVCDF